MTIAEVLSSQESIEHGQLGTLFIDGFVTPDHEKEWVRVYTDPSDKSNYFLIKSTDVKGEIHEWNEHELAAAGHVGVKVYRLAVPRGIEVFAVNIRSEKLGETVAPERPRSLEKSGSHSSCQRSTGCRTGCCTWNGGRCTCDYCCVS